MYEGWCHLHSCYLSKENKNTSVLFLQKKKNGSEGPYVMIWCDLSYFTQVLCPLDRNCKKYLADQDSISDKRKLNISTNCYCESNESSLMMYKKSGGWCTHPKCLGLCEVHWNRPVVCAYVSTSRTGRPSGNLEQGKNV